MNQSTPTSRDERKDARRPPLDCIKPEVREMAGYRLKHYDCPVKLNQNESPFDVPDDVKDRILAAVRNASWSRYPEPMPSDLVAAIADYASVEPENIVVSNGSNTLAAILLSVTVSPGVPVVMPSPSFSLYEQYTRINGGHTVPIPLRDDFEYDVGRLIEASRGAGVVIVCSPNNPTGTMMSDTDIEAVLSSTDSIVLVDEAYGEFSGTDVTRLLGRYPNLVVLRTLSKAFGAAGLRIGYLIAHPAIVAEVVKGKLPFNVGFFPCIAALEILGNGDLIRQRIDSILRERDRVFEALKLMQGISPVPSHANFICFSVVEQAGVSGRAEVFERMIEQGVLVRDVSSYPQLEQSLRVTIGTAEENDHFLQALESALRKTV